MVHRTEPNLDHSSMAPPHVRSEIVQQSANPPAFCERFEMELM